MAVLLKVFVYILKLKLISEYVPLFSKLVQEWTSANAHGAKWDSFLSSLSATPTPLSKGNCYQKYGQFYFVFPLLLEFSNLDLAVKLSGPFSLMVYIRANSNQVKFLISSSLRFYHIFTPNIFVFLLGQACQKFVYFIVLSKEHDLGTIKLLFLLFLLRNNNSII